MNNIMLDIETLDNKKTAAMVQLAALRFDPLTGETGKSFKVNIDFDDAVKHGTVSGGTVQWWLQQDKAAQNALTDSDGRVTLDEALKQFHIWLMDIPYKQRKLWGNGITFDNVIVRHAFSAVGCECPWPFYGDSDVRTVVDMGVLLLDGIDHKRITPFEGIKHDALDDCKHQVKYVSAILRHVKERMNASQ